MSLCKASIQLFHLMFSDPPCQQKLQLFPANMLIKNLLVVVLHGVNRGQVIQTPFAIVAVQLLQDMGTQFHGFNACN